MIARIRMPCTMNQSAMFILLKLRIHEASLPDSNVYASIVELKHQLMAKLACFEVRIGNCK